MPLVFDVQNGLFCLNQCCVTSHKVGSVPVLSSPRLRSFHSAIIFEQGQLLRSYKESYKEIDNPVENLINLTRFIALFALFWLLDHHRFVPRFQVLLHLKPFLMMSGWW